MAGYGADTVLQPPQIVDACVKNGDFKVHKVVASKAFMGAMAALAQGKRVRGCIRACFAAAPPGLCFGCCRQVTPLLCGAQGDDVAAKAAGLIQTWGVNFESIKDALPGFCETYASLKAKVLLGWRALGLRSGLSVCCGGCRCWRRG